MSFLYFLLWFSTTTHVPISNYCTGVSATEVAWASPALEALKSAVAHHESRHGSIGGLPSIHQNLDIAKILQMKQFWGFCRKRMTSKNIQTSSNHYIFQSDELLPLNQP